MATIGIDSTSGLGNYTAATTEPHRLQFFGAYRPFSDEPVTEVGYRAGGTAGQAGQQEVGLYRTDTLAKLISTTVTGISNGRAAQSVSATLSGGVPYAVAFRSVASTSLIRAYNTAGTCGTSALTGASALADPFVQSATDDQKYGVFATVTDLTSDVVYDNATAAQSAVNTTTHTFTHTASGTNRVVYVSATIDSNTAMGITSVTYGGQAMTLVGSLAPTVSNRQIHVYRLIAPPTGAQDVVVNWTTSSTGFFTAVSYTGVNQTTPDGAVATAGGNTASSTASVTASNGDRVVGFYAFNNLATTKLVSGTRRALQGDGAYMGTAVSDGAVTGNANAVLDIASAQFNGVLAFAIKPASVSMPPHTRNTTITVNPSTPTGSQTMTVNYSDGSSATRALTVVRPIQVSFNATDGTLLVIGNGSNYTGTLDKYTVWDKDPRHDATAAVVLTGTNLSVTAGVAVIGAYGDPLVNGTTYWVVVSENDDSLYAIAPLVAG